MVKFFLLERVVLFKFFLLPLRMLQFRRSLRPAALRSALRSAPPLAPPLAGRASCPLAGRARFASAASSAASSGGGRLAAAGLAAAAAAAAGYGAWQLQLGAGEDEAAPLSGGGGGGGVPEASLTRRQLEAIYAFEKRIGQGGFGDVWLARDAKSGRQVAVKLISLEKLPRAMVEVEVEAMRRCGRAQHLCRPASAAAFCLHSACIHTARRLSPVHHRAAGRVLGPARGACGRQRPCRGGDCDGAGRRRRLSLAEITRDHARSAEIVMEARRRRRRPEMTREIREIIGDHSRSPEIARGAPLGTFLWQACSSAWLRRARTRSRSHPRSSSRCEMRPRDGARLGCHTLPAALHTSSVHVATSANNRVPMYFFSQVALSIYHLHSRGTRYRRPQQGGGNQLISD